MKIGITADCSSGVEYADFKHNIKITRTTINFKDKTLVDGIDIKVDEFYDMLEKIDEVPSTAAPSIGEITNRVNEWKEEGCTDVIHFPISFGLSPYGQNLSQLADELFEGINVHFFPSKQACIMQGYVAHYGEILANNGKTPDAKKRQQKGERKRRASQRARSKDVRSVLHERIIAKIAAFSIHKYINIYSLYKIIHLTKLSGVLFT